MVNVRFPLALYGKPADASSDAGGYRFLVRHPAFDSPPIDRALRRLVAALEWKPASHRHAPVFGMLREGEATLVARFVDDGRDPNGRPHALRVECVLLHRRKPTDALLSGEVWAGLSGTETDAVELRLPDAEDAPIDVHGERILLFGDETQFARSDSAEARPLRAIPPDGNSP